MSLCVLLGFGLILVLHYHLVTITFRYVYKINVLFSLFWKINYNLEMEAEELDGRKLTIDSIMNKVRDIKNKINEDLTDELSSNKICADPTGEFFFSLKKTNKQNPNFIECL